ncbi:uncharacterized protein LOC142217149 [Leptodactylus fuscus]|uniref:uncharacterized protein LOC142217149 n=1 Tax=Leptodactylus fuscus TaxID=238119 RepID=UPI003F4EE315
MEAAHVVVLLLLLLQTVSALKLFVPPSHKAVLGKNVQIPCSFSVDKPPVQRSLLEIIWYFQGQQVLRVDDKSEKIPNPRLSYVDKAWDRGADLIISNTILSDGGLYKCAVIYGSQRKEGEVRLDIQAPPQATITDKTVLMNTTSVLRCSITGFYPVDIDVKWFRGAERLNDVTVETPRRNQDGLYNVNSSVMIIPSEEDREQNFSCTVQHESLQQPLQEMFQLSYGAVPTIHILPHTFIKNVEQILVCQVSGFYPESIVVNWFMNGIPMEKTAMKRINSSALEAVLHFMPTEENWGMEVSCVVEHETLLRPQVKSLEVLGKDLKAKHKHLVLMVSVLLSVIFGAGTISFYVFRYMRKRHPKLRNITHTTDGCFSLNVDHFYPKEISVTWQVFQPPSSKNPQVLQPTYLMQENQDGTYNVTSTTESLRDKVNESEEYLLRATVTHQKLKPPAYREWTNRNTDNKYLMSSPELGEILTPNLMLNSQAQLQCTISHYYPDNLTVNWIRKVMGNEEIIETSEKYKITPRRSQHQRDKTFTCTTGLVLTPSLEDQGSEIICRVTHPSLEQPVERSTGQIQVWVKPTTDQSIQLSINDSGGVTASLLLLNFYPKDIKVTWTHGQSQVKKPSEETTTENPDGTFSINTKCKIPGHLFEEKGFIIKVTWKHETMDKEECREMSVGHPVTPQMEKTVTLTLSDANNVKCSMSLIKFYPSNIKVTWTHKEDNKLISSTRKLIQTDDEQTFAATSECTIPWKYFTSEVRVTWEHESLTSPQYRDLHVTDFPWHPVIEIDQQAFYVNTEATLQCRISQYFPSDLTVTWCMKSKTGNVYVTDNTTPIAQRQPDNMYSCTACLTFTPSVREHDGAEIICRVQHPTLRKYIEKSTGPIQVYAPPSMQGPIQWSLSETGDVLCTLRLQSFYPKPMEISWRSTSHRSLTSREIYEDNPDSTSNVTSVCTVTQENINDSDYGIVVTWKHNSMLKPGKSKMYIRDAGLPWYPTVSEIVTPDMLLNKDVNLHCDISGFFPNKLNVIWFIKERGSQNYTTVDQCKSRYKAELTNLQYFNNGYQSTASLQFRPLLQHHHGIWVMCRVQHPSLQLHIERTAGPLFISLTPQLIQREIILTPYSRDEVVCSVNLKKFFPKNLKITWKNGGHDVMATKTILQVNGEEEETFDAISECKIPWTQLSAPVQVTWGHVSMENPECLKLQHAASFWRPTLHDIEKPVLTEMNEAKLRCRISGYFPDNVTVSWYKKEGALEPVQDKDKYKTSVTESQRQPDSTYSCTASLRFTSSLRDQGSELICRVEHPSLERPIERSSGPLQVQKTRRIQA